MKKFINDHVALFTVCAFVLAGVALYFAIKADKNSVKVAETVAKNTKTLAQLTGTAAEPEGNEEKTPTK